MSIITPAKENNADAVAAALDLLKTNDTDFYWQITDKCCDGKTPHKCCDGKTPLAWAVHHNNAAMTRSLLAYHPRRQLIQKSKAGETPINTASKEGKWDVVIAIAESYKIDGGDSPSCEYGSALLRAAVANQTPVVKALLSANASNIWVTEKTKDTSLHYAIDHDNAKMVKLLLTKSPRHQLKQQNQYSNNKNQIFHHPKPMHWAATKGKRQAVIAIAQSYKTDNYDKLDYKSALKIFIEKNDFEVVQVLLKANTPIAATLEIIAQEVLLEDSNKINTIKEEINTPGFNLNQTNTNESLSAEYLSDCKKLLTNMLDIRNTYQGDELRRSHTILWIEHTVSNGYEKHKNNLTPENTQKFLIDLIAMLNIQLALTKEDHKKNGGLRYAHFFTHKQSRLEKILDSVLAEANTCLKSLTTKASKEKETQGIKDAHSATPAEPNNPHAVLLEY